MKSSRFFSRLAALAVTACLLLAAVPAQAATGLAGSGTAADPWIIDSEFALTMAYQRMMGEGAAEHYRLTADITLTKALDNSFMASAGVLTTGASQAMLAPGAVFDGGGHTISNLTVNSTSNEGGGFSFFEYNAGTIKDLNLVYADSYVYTGYDAAWGGIADYNAGVVTGCSVTADLTIGDLPASNVYEGGGFGLIAGATYSGSSITGCTAAGSIHGPAQHTGGLVGTDQSAGGVTGCTDLVSVNGAAAGSPLPNVITVTLDGQLLTFDQPPIAVDGRTMVPVRAIFEALGAEVVWDPSDQSVFAYRASDGVAVLMYLDDTVMAYKSGAGAEARAIELDVPPFAINNRTLVPVRAVSESFNCTVDWDQAKQQVIITTH